VSDFGSLLEFPLGRKEALATGRAKQKAARVALFAGALILSACPVLAQAGRTAFDLKPQDLLSTAAPSLRNHWALPRPAEPESHAWAMLQSQQNLYHPSVQEMTPGPSTYSGPRMSVPGLGPTLRRTCPEDACSMTQTVMCCGVAPSPFSQYLKSPLAVPLTWKDNLRSAGKNIIDPFNLLTIVADAAIGVATNSHSPYGPGLMGISKYAGVSMTEDLTGEFFGTFLVPSLLHQDVHYHREPFMPIKHRILHSIVQVVWSQSTTGRPMPNYANIVGGIATAVVSNTFVPGPGRQGFSSTAQRLAIAYATSPSGNLIEEFVPDIASRINLRVVIFQRILNTVAIEEGGGPGTAEP
jgi:hypothetical protein